MSFNVAKAETVAAIEPANGARAVGKGEIRTLDTDYASLEEALTATPANTILEVRGSWSRATTWTINKTVVVDFAQSGSITFTSATVSGIEVTAPSTILKGPGTITSPAIFDGITDAPHYGVIRVTADNCSVSDINLVNVPKVGVYFDDTNKINVSRVSIVGNYPASSYTGVETAHFGIAFNPGASAGSGCGIVSGNSVIGCVQGIFIGNYGVSGTAYGLVINGNDINQCHNHGIYNAGGVDACAVSGNTFSHCQTPIVLTGKVHSVTGNNIVTMGTGSGQDIVGINMRDSVDCTVTGNVIKGDAGTGNVVINFAHSVSGNTTISGNTVTGNTVDVTNGTAVGIRIGDPTKTTVCTDNIVANNVVRAPGIVNNGVIAIAPQAASISSGNKITGNDIVVRGQSHGVYNSNSTHTTIQNNSIRFEWNAPSAQTLAFIQLAVAIQSVVSNNDFLNGAGFGTNVALRGVWELAGCLNNTYGPNKQDPGTGLTSYTPFVTVSGSKAIIDSITPENFGAIGDGVIDDTAAINAALSAAANNFETVVVFKNKTYATAPFVIPVGVTVEGHGTTIKRTVSTGSVRFITMSSNSILRGVTVDCGGSLTTSSGVYMSGVDNVLVDKCKISNMIGSDIITVQSTTNSKIRDTIVDTCFMGVHVYDTSKYVTLQDVRVQNWQQRGIYVAASSTLAPTDIDIIHCLVTDLVSPSPNGATVREPIQISGNPTARIQRIRILESKVVGLSKSYTDPTTPGTADQFNASYIDGLLIRNCISINGGDCGFSGAQNTNQSHVGNYAAYNDTAGIAVGGGSGGCNGVVLSSNTCVNNHQNRVGDRQIASGPGIYLYQTSNITISGNNLGDTQATPTQAVGIASHINCNNINMIGNVAAGVTFNQLFTDDGTSTNIQAQDRVASAVPTSGTWVVGQRIKNSVPTVGQPKAWVVTASGGAYSKSWTPSTPYNAGDWVSNTSLHVLACVVGGTSGTGVNAVNGGAWGSIGGTIVDGTVTWVYMANTSAAFASEGNL